MIDYSRFLFDAFHKKDFRMMNTIIHQTDFRISCMERISLYAILESTTETNPEFFKVLKNMMNCNGFCPEIAFDYLMLWDIVGSEELMNDVADYLAIRAFQIIDRQSGMTCLSNIIYHIGISDQARLSVFKKCVDKFSFEIDKNIRLQTRSNILIAIIMNISEKKNDKCLISMFKYLVHHVKSEIRLDLLQGVKMNKKIIRQLTNICNGRNMSVSMHS